MNVLSWINVFTTTWRTDEIFSSFIQYIGRHSGQAKKSMRHLQIRWNKISNTNAKHCWKYMTEGGSHGSAMNKAWANSHRFGITLEAERNSALGTRAVNHQVSARRTRRLPRRMLLLLIFDSRKSFAKLPFFQELSHFPKVHSWALTEPIAFITSLWIRIMRLTTNPVHSSRGHRSSKKSTIL